MVGKVFLVALLFLYIVTQIHATYKWINKDDFIKAIGEHYLEPKGLNVVSAAYNDENRTTICMLGAEDGALMYEAQAVQITDHTPTSIKVTIPGIAKYRDVTATITVDMDVIECASNLSEHVMKKFFFGRGPIAKSIAVYARDLNDENAVAECYGMFADVYGVPDPVIIN